MKQAARGHGNVKRGTFSMSCSRRPAPAANPSRGRGDNAHHTTSIAATRASGVLQENDLSARQILSDLSVNEKSGGTSSHAGFRKRRILKMQ